MEIIIGKRYRITGGMFKQDTVIVKEILEQKVKGNVYLKEMPTGIMTQVLYIQKEHLGEEVVIDE